MMPVSSKKKENSSDKHDSWQQTPALFTLYYFLVTLPIIYILVQEGYIDRTNDFSLNAFGDFLAGYFSPVGIIWIVASFHQQGEDLDASVAAQRDLAAALIDQNIITNRIHAYNSKPRITLYDPRIDILETSEKETTAEISLKAHNNGSTAFDATIKHVTPPLKFAKPYELDRQELHEYEYQCAKENHFRDPIPFSSYSPTQKIDVFRKGESIRFALQLTDVKKPSLQRALNSARVDPKHSSAAEWKAGRRNVYLEVSFKNENNHSIQELWAIKVSPIDPPSIEKIDEKDLPDRVHVGSKIILSS